MHRKSGHIKPNQHSTFVNIKYQCPMKFIIEDEQFTYMCDFEKPITDEDESRKKFPDVDEAIDSFFRLLESIYSAEKIADCLASGELAALDYSEKGIKAREILRKQ